MSAISLGPRRIGVKWSKPINPFGPINNYRIFYKIVRREAANNENSVIVSALRKEANLTGLAPYTNYRIAIAAVNIRDGDKKILLGTRSNEAIVQTDEDGIEKSLYLSACLVLCCVFSSICSTESHLYSFDAKVGENTMASA